MKNEDLTPSSSSSSFYLVVSLQDGCLFIFSIIEINQGQLLIATGEGSGCCGQNAAPALGLMRKVGVLLSVYLGDLNSSSASE